MNRTAFTVGAFLLATSTVLAQDCRSRCKPKDDFQRAGNPQRVAWWAVPSDTGHYLPYLVGGGQPYHGDRPCRGEGTVGWDYKGLLPANAIRLFWSHGRYQGGIGAYRTEGKNCESKSSP
jgi:hypothetical protein